MTYYPHYVILFSKKIAAFLFNRNHYQAICILIIKDSLCAQTPWNPHSFSSNLPSFIAKLAFNRYFDHFLGRNCSAIFFLNRHDTPVQLCICVRVRKIVSIHLAIRFESRWELDRRIWSWMEVIVGLILKECKLLILEKRFAKTILLPLKFVLELFRWTKASQNNPNFL